MHSCDLVCNSDIFVATTTYIHVHACAYILACRVWSNKSIPCPHYLYFIQYSAEPELTPDSLFFGVKYFVQLVTIRAGSRIFE